MTVSSTRRQNLREATVTDIKTAAWADMAESDSVDCSLRGVARRLGMAPSALYRYFASREELLTALIVDAFDELTAVLQTAHAETQAATPAVRGGEVFVAVAGAYRRWALGHPLRYRLIFGNPVGGYQGTPRTTAASLRSTDVLLDVMRGLVRADQLDVDRVGRDLTPASRERYAQWSSVLDDALSPEALAACITCYSALHGAIGLELNRHLPPPLLQVDDVFVATMRQVVATILR